MWVNAVKASVKDGRVTGWRHRIVGQSIAVGTAFEDAMINDGVDTTSVDVSADSK